MRRRGVGVAGLHKRMAQKAKVEEAGQALQIENLEHVSEL